MHIMRTRSHGNSSLKSAASAALAGLGRSIAGGLQHMAGRPRRRESADRRLLETAILPAYASDPGVGRILFCGCAPYTQHYEAIFRGRDYWTLDPVPRHRRHGAARHVVAGLQDLAQHFPAATFDLVVCNGVLGWGLDTAGDAEAAFAACTTGLRAGGHLLLGWNDVWPHNRVTPERISALRRFEPIPLGPHAARVRVAAPHRHVFDFYRKRTAGTATSG